MSSYSIVPMGKRVLEGLEDIPLMGQRVDQALSDLAADVYDSAAWSALLSECIAVNTPIEKMRVLYERFVTVYPTAARTWSVYIESEQKHTAGGLEAMIDRVEKLFERCLVSCYDVDLYRTYLEHIRSVHNADDMKNRNAIIEAYEFSIAQVGMDLGSTWIYRDYIEYINNLKTSTVTEQNQVQQQIRNVYQRAIVQPLNDTEQLYREWDSWEHQINREQAATFIAEYTERYLKAKQIGRERKKRRAGILPQMLARPPRETTQAQQRDAQQVIAWKRYMLYEKSNPQRLERTELRQRVLFGYKQCLVSHRHNADMWYEYAEFVGSYSVEDALKVYQQACQAMPYSLAIYLLKADFLERHQKFDQAHAVYTEELLTRAREPQQYIRWPTLDEQGLLLQTSEHVAAVKAEQKVTQKAAANGIANHHVDSVPLYTIADNDLTRAGFYSGEALAWTVYIRFCRRVYGVDSARKAFLTARKHSTAADSYQLYLAAARMEWLTNKDIPLANKILTTGAMKFHSHIDFMAQYIQHLQAINDQNNLRVVLERVFAETTPADDDDNPVGEQRAAALKKEGSSQVQNALAAAQHAINDEKHAALDDKNALSSSSEESFDLSTASAAAPRIIALWQRYVELERWTATDLQTIETAETRRDAALRQKVHPIAHAIDRMRFLDLWPITNALRMLIKATAPHVVEQGLVLYQSRHMDRMVNDAERDAIALSRSTAFARPDTSKMLAYQPTEAMVAVERDKLRDVYSKPGAAIAAHNNASVNPADFSSQGILPNAILDVLTQFWHRPYSAPPVNADLLMQAVVLTPEQKQLDAIKLPDGILIDKAVEDAKVKNELANGNDSYMKDGAEAGADGAEPVDPHQPPEEDLFRIDTRPAVAGNGTHRDASASVQQLPPAKRAKLEAGT